MVGALSRRGFWWDEHDGQPINTDNFSFHVILSFSTTMLPPMSRRS